MSDKTITVIFTKEEMEQLTGILFNAPVPYAIMHPLAQKLMLAVNTYNNEIDPEHNEPLEYEKTQSETPKEHTA